MAVSFGTIKVPVELNIVWRRPDAEDIVVGTLTTEVDVKADFRSDGTVNAEVVDRG